MWHHSRRGGALRSSTAAAAAATFPHTLAVAAVASPALGSSAVAVATPSLRHAFSASALFVALPSANLNGTLPTATNTTSTFAASVAFTTPAVPPSTTAASVAPTLHACGDA